MWRGIACRKAAVEVEAAIENERREQPNSRHDCGLQVPHKLVSGVW
jgi:hypothetical protein